MRTFSFIILQSFLYNNSVFNTESCMILWQKQIKKLEWIFPKIPISSAQFFSEKIYFLCTYLVRNDFLFRPKTKHNTLTPSPLQLSPLFLSCLNSLSYSITLTPNFSMSISNISLFSCTIFKTVLPCYSYPL